MVFFLAAMASFSVSADRAHEDLFSYLMLHPDILKNETVACQNMFDPGKALTQRCETVMQATDQMMTLIESQQKNPEKFGQEILQAQMDLAVSDTPANQDKVRILLKVVGLGSPE